MRNKFLYNGLNKDSLLNALMHISLNIDNISVLISNVENNNENYPRSYINFEIIAGVGSEKNLVSNSDSLNKLSKLHSKHKDWLFGYLSYDLKNEIEKLNSKNRDNFKSHNVSFFSPEYVLLFKNDILEIQTYRSRKVCDKFVDDFIFLDLPPSNINVNFSRSDDKLSYIKKIKEIQQHIKLGNIYELNYCQEFYSKGVKVIPETIFVDLNHKMKTPFSCFVKIQKQYILSSSPERFIRKEKSEILSQPIKGTQKRGLTKKEDIDLLNELQSSQKDISENVMITDLVRNDLSRISKKGSVQVYELCKVYTFRKVHQMISTIISEIDSGIDFSEILRATFPMGSMTGAPKLKAMELIEYFENFKRGIFSGSVGYITPNADFDFNVVIRTILYNLANNYLSIGVGGAITMKSEPAKEYKECIIKAQPLFDIFDFKIND